MDISLLQSILGALSSLGAFCGWLYTILRSKRHRANRMEETSEAKILRLERKLARIAKRLAALEKPKPPRRPPPAAARS